MLPASGSPRSMKRLIRAPSSSTATRVSYGSTVAMISLVIWTPTLDVLEQNLFASHSHVEEQSGRAHHRHQGAAAVTDEGQWNGGNRRQPHRHPHVEEQVKSDHSQLHQSHQ